MSPAGGATSSGPAGTPVVPAQTRAEVVAAGWSGVYRHLVLQAPVAARALPGQFVALAVGDRTSAMLLRRAFSIHRVDAGAGTVEVVVAAHGAGTRWVCERTVGDEVDLVGPLGTGFTLPRGRSGEPGRLVLVGGGYGSAPFAWTADVAASAGTVVDAVVGAAEAARLCDVEGVRTAVEATGGRLVVTTEDGSQGERGRVTDPLAGLVAAAGGSVTVAACGPMAMLRAVAGTVADHVAVSGQQVQVQVAVEEAMACGVGVCMTCVLPVRDADGVTRMLRACTDGPVLDAALVRWDAVGARGAAVPADALGAPAGGAA